MRYPVDDGQYFVSQSFGPGHTALDIAANEGVAIKSPESGVIELVNNNPTGYFGGNYLVIVGDSGYRHYLGHNSSNIVSRNQRVNEGQHIANIGSTGLATGPHTHWEVSRGGISIDPSSLIVNTTQEEEELKIEDNIDEYNRALGLHRSTRGPEFTYEYFKQNLVGMLWRTYIDAMLNNPEAIFRRTAGDVGTIAINDNWQSKLVQSGDKSADSEKIKDAVRKAQEALDAVKQIGGIK